LKLKTLNYYLSIKCDNIKYLKDYTKTAYSAVGA
jgi:hypothetical protein